MSTVWEDPLGCWLGKRPPEAGHGFGQQSLFHRLESSRGHVDLPCQSLVGVLHTCSIHTVRTSPPNVGTCCECVLPSQECSTSEFLGSASNPGCLVHSSYFLFPKTTCLEIVLWKCRASKSSVYKVTFGYI